MVLASVAHEPVWVVHPVLCRREMVLRAKLFLIGWLNLGDSCGACDVDEVVSADSPTEGLGVRTLVGEVVRDGLMQTGDATK
jgi:hypothetical protein